MAPPSIRNLNQWPLPCLHPPPPASSPVWLFIWSPVKRPQRTWTLLTVGPLEEGRFTGWTGVAFIHGWEKKQGGRKGKRTSSHLFFWLTSNPLSSSRPIQSHFNLPVNVSENAPSYYITYAVHQSDRVWITLSMTPKSWRQPKGPQATSNSCCYIWIAGTRRGEALPGAVTERNFFPRRLAFTTSVRTWRKVTLAAGQTRGSRFNFRFLYGCFCGRLLTWRTRWNVSSVLWTYCPSSDEPAESVYGEGN